MFKRYKCCIFCHDCIFEESELAADLWIKLCGLSIPDGYIAMELTTEFHEDLCLLEKKGFIITHETDEELQIRIEGTLQDDEDADWCFCIDDFSHTKKMH